MKRKAKQQCWCMGCKKVPTPGKGLCPSCNELVAFMHSIVDEPERARHWEAVDSARRLELHRKRAAGLSLTGRRL